MRISKAIFPIILLAAVLRLTAFGHNPPGVYLDEAAQGYNAYSLLRTGKDEYGKSWPVFLRSFGDYKMPLYAYLTVPSVKIFGLDSFSTRFVSAAFARACCGCCGGDFPGACLYVQDSRRSKSGPHPVFPGGGIGFAFFPSSHFSSPLLSFSRPVRVCLSLLPFFVSGHGPLFYPHL